MLPAQDERLVLAFSGRCFNAIMICRHHISSKEACFIAIESLDDLVTDLLKSGCRQIPPLFLDWIADEATPLVEQHVAHLFSSPRFADSLRIGDPRIALARWVRHWVGPRIVAEFDQLAVYLLEFAASSSASGPSPQPARLRRRSFSA